GFDQSGNQVTRANALGIVTTNIFDSINRVIEIDYPDKTKTQSRYDASGRQVAETNQDGIVTFFEYDGVGRLTSVTNAFGTAQQIRTRYEYDEAENRTTQFDALGRATQFEYDALSRRTRRIMPSGESEGFAYDLAGNLLRHTNFNGFVITNIYDMLS